VTQGWRSDDVKVEARFLHDPIQKEPRNTASIQGAYSEDRLLSCREKMGDAGGAGIPCCKVLVVADVT